ncbi:zinc finger BED domain-containing protein RICESLEEPER 3 [Tanacetum coccineum]
MATSMLVEMTDMPKKAPMGIVKNVLVKIDKFVFPSDFVIIDMLGDPNETMILGRSFLATIYARINVFRREISLGIREDMVLFDVNGNVYHPTVPIKKVYMANSIQEEESFNHLEIGEDLFSNDSPLCLEFEKYNHVYDTNENNEDTFVCDDIVMGNDTCIFWPTRDPNLKDCNRGDSAYGMDKHGVPKHWYGNSKIDDITRERRYCTK